MVALGNMLCTCQARRVDLRYRQLFFERDSDFRHRTRRNTSRCLWFDGRLHSYLWFGHYMTHERLGTLRLVGLGVFGEMCVVGWGFFDRFGCLAAVVCNTFFGSWRLGVVLTRGDGLNHSWCMRSCVWLSDKPVDHPSPL